MAVAELTVVLLCCAVLCCSVSDMLPRCADAGISVKYGRKVLQRLQAVGPARKALTAAVASKSPGLSELEEALGAAKVCRCLLEDDLLQVRGVCQYLDVSIWRIASGCSVKGQWQHECEMHDAGQ